MSQPKMARFRIDHSDPAYPKLRRTRGTVIADNVSTFHTLGEAKKELMSELTSMRDHYLGLIKDVRNTTVKQLDDEAELDQ